ncbi:efflux RND transporter permease subunit [Candidatus Gracilibacteria bacterium]|nr:efflux RND transporter permease subunit [Candidatus Gracilibacteria bacterium]
MSKHNDSIYLQKLEFDENLNKSWMAFFIDRVRFTWLVIIIILISGTIGLKNLPLESMPEVDIGMAYIITTLPGASPESIEDLVTKKIEKQISKVEGIDTVTSTSMNSSSMVMVQFVSGTDTKKAVSDLKDKVDLAKPDMPKDILEPIVKEVAFDQMPIWTFSISGNFDGYRLYEYAKTIKDELERQALISEVNISGGLQKEFGVLIDPKKLEKYKLNLTIVNQSISSVNMTIPIGSIEIGDYKHTLNVDERFYNLDKLKKVVVGKTGDTGLIYLEDIAEVKEIPKKITSISRLSVNGKEPKNAITLSVVKKKGGSIVDVITNGTKTLDEMRKKGFIPKNLEITTVVDNAKEIKSDLSHLIRDGLITIALVFITLLLIIGAKEALVAGTAVPIVFLITFAIMSAFGQTLNFLSMFALILSLGLLVDDAIVVISAINQYKKSGKFTTREAALLVIRDYKKVLTTTTLTVVFIFASMLFMTGMIGSFIYPIPFVVSVVLLASLFIALTLNPALAVLISGKDSKVDFEKHSNIKGKKGLLKKALDQGFISIHSLEQKYGDILENLIKTPKKLKKFLFGIFILFISAFLLPITGILKSNFFPATDADNFYVNLELEPGTKLEKTQKEVSYIENILRKEKDIESFSTSVGTPTSSDGRGNSNSEQYAIISVKLFSTDDGRKEKSYKIAQRIRDNLKDYKIGKVSIVEQSAGPGNSAAFEIKIAGEDFDTLDKITLDVKKTLSTIPGVIDITTSKKPLPFEFEISLDPSKLALYDLSIPQVATFLKNVIDGSEASKIYNKDEEIIIRTKFDPTLVDNFDKIKDLKIKNNKGIDVYLRDIVSQNFKSSIFSISRVDGERVVTISAGAKAGFNGTTIQASFDKKMKNYKLPTGYKFITGGESEENAKSIKSLGVSMMYGLICIIGLLVLLYDSYKQAFLVMITIPLSLIGVFFGLTLFGQPLSFPGMIGLVALFGIVVRNGIILFDKINQNLEEDIEFRESIIDAGISRLEPVLLTSICTVLGMIPLTLSNPTWTGLGLSIIFGLSTSTFFTLLVLPSLYYIFFRKKYVK